MPRKSRSQGSGPGYRAQCGAVVLGVPSWWRPVSVAAGIALAFYFTANKTACQKRWLMRMTFLSLPVPWIAIEAGWFVAEYGHSLAIGEVLPTMLGTSTLTYWDVMGSMIGFHPVLFDPAGDRDVLMIRFAWLGPSSLHTGRYFREAGWWRSAGFWLMADKLSSRI
ncbi:MAG: cytochrome ubiquinol oxidase subunit I [Thiolinea sp.]